MHTGVQKIEPRKFDVVQVDAVQDWKIEVRRRLTGKLAGSTYKVFVAPTGVKYYSLAKAKADGGFDGGEVVDGRKNRKKAADKS